MQYKLNIKIESVMSKIKVKLEVKSQIKQTAGQLMMSAQSSHLSFTFKS